MEEPLEGIIKRLNKCADFAAAVGESVTETQLFSIKYVIVVDTGKYLEYFLA